MIHRIDHVNLVVADLDATAAFYRDVLGFRLTKDVTISGAWIDHVVGLSGVRARVIYLDLPEGPRIELIHYESPPGEDPGLRGKANTRGFRHMAFTVDDIDALSARLRNAGVELLSEVQAVPASQVTFGAGDVRKRLVYFRDPEGNLLELCEYKPAAG
jgi:catechol 2,3-dioxygenase-like lactoylglutathione lyase family enzyme